MVAHGHGRFGTKRGPYDAAMLCTMFGWLSPMRVSMITTLLKLGLPHECLAEGCSCNAKRLHDIKSSDALGARWHHHKTARKQGGQPIANRIPDD